MKFFNPKPRELTQPQKNKIMARKILEQLGIEKNEYSANISKSGGYYHDRVYEGFGLKIVEPDYLRGEKGLYIDFDNIRMQDSRMYISGSWETVLYELYNKIPLILDKQNREKELLARKSSTAFVVEQIALRKDLVIIMMFSVFSAEVQQAKTENL